MSTNRIDAEVSTLKKQLELRASHDHGGDSHETNIKQSDAPTIEVNMTAATFLFIGFWYCHFWSGVLLLISHRC